MSDTPAWNDELLKRDPHTAADKRSRVQKMFAAIAPRYDLNNRLHSFWRDQAWRRAAVKLAELKPTDVVVDVACGTGDLTLAFRAANPQAVIGIDFTYEMLPLARGKSAASPQGPSIRFLNGDATALPLPDACCDVVSIAFGIRNVQEPEKALAEFRRILRPGGRVIVLEFSEPTHPLIRSVNRLYTGKIMPVTATLLSGDKSGAYKYLPKSIGTFWTREKMVQMLSGAGFDDIAHRVMTFGVCVCYRGTSPGD